MTSPPIAALLDKLAAVILAADPTDIDSIEEAIGILEEIRTASASSPIAYHVDACIAHLKAIVLGTTRNPRVDFDAACALAAEIQQKLGAELAAAAASPRPLRPSIDPSIVRDFVESARLSLDDAETEVMAAEKGNPEAISMLKRRLHTLKGEAGVLGMPTVSRVCHAVEELLSLPPSSPEWADRMLRACDWIRGAVGVATSGAPEPSADDLLQMLQESTGQTPQAPPAKAKVVTAPTPPKSLPEIASFATPVRIEAAAPVDRDQETVALFCEFLNESEDGLAKADQVLMNIEREGIDPDTVNGLFRIFHTIKGVAGVLDLQEITKLAHVTESMLNKVREGKMELRAHVVDLVFDATELMGAMLRRVRLAIEHSSEVPKTEGLPALVQRIEATLNGNPIIDPLPQARPGAKLGEILALAPLSIHPKLVEEALEAQKTSGRRLGEELVARGVASPKQVSQALRVQNAVAEPTQVTHPGAGKLQETIKVDLSRVDTLVEMIGELVIVETMVVHAPEVVGLTSPRIQTYLSQLSKITRDLQDVGMRMRMVPVRSVFQKMARMARDLAKKSDKQIRLVPIGEGTEMDRSMVEQIADPLVHMIRNAVDHGLEPAADRQSAGKPVMGTVRLAAYHEGGSIVIEVTDDGRGLDRDNILRKARAQGLVDEGDKLTDAEVYNLIFAPGFSTAAQVTEISGRGVGMDVVKRNIEQMRGRVLISTRSGEGTTFKIVLPLTLAIIDGMLVRIGEERYIIPTLSIIESIQPSQSMLVSFASKRELVNVRGEILPLLRLDRLFSIPDGQSDPTRGLVVVVESLGRKLGLLVDEVITQQQVVIKSLGAALSAIRFVAGAAILSDGRVGLILNMEEIGSLVGYDAITRSYDRTTGNRTQTQEGTA